MASIRTFLWAKHVTSAQCTCLYPPTSGQWGGPFDCRHLMRNTTVVINNPPLQKQTIPDQLLYTWQWFVSFTFFISTLISVYLPTGVARRCLTGCLWDLHSGSSAVAGPFCPERVQQRFSDDALKVHVISTVFNPDWKETSSPIYFHKI